MSEEELEEFIHYLLLLNRSGSKEVGKLFLAGIDEFLLFISSGQLFAFCPECEQHKPDVEDSWLGILCWDCKNRIEMVESQYY